MVYEARGDKQLAANHYHKVIDFVRARPDQFDQGFEDTFRRLVQKLDPSSTDYFARVNAQALFRCCIPIFG